MPIIKRKVGSILATEVTEKCAEFHYGAFFDGGTDYFLRQYIIFHSQCSLCSQWLIFFRLAKFA